MFNQLKHIDTAFTYVRGFTLVIILGCLGLCGFVLYKSFQLPAATQSKVYILVNGKALEAFAGDRETNLVVERSTLLQKIENQTIETKSRVK